MIGLTPHHSYYFFSEYADMRKGFDGLSGLVMKFMERDPADGNVYIFVNRRRDRMKMLVWEQSGFTLYYKRLESGTFQWPGRVNEGGGMILEWETLVMMISGICLEKIVRKKRYKRA